MLVICSFDFRYKIVPALLVALIVTYNAPHYLAKLRISSEEAAAKRQERALANDGTDAANNSTIGGVNGGAGGGASNSNPNFVATATTTTNINPDTKTETGTNNNTVGRCAACGRWYASVCEYYGEMSLKRKGVMMVAVRYVSCVLLCGEYIRQH